MASRYGRKKRRQHLEALAALQSDLRFIADIQAAERQMLRKAMDERDTLVSFQRRWNEHLRHMLGEHTALASEPLEMDPGMPLRRVRRVRIDAPVSAPGETGPETVSIEPVSLVEAAENLIQIVGGLSDADRMTLKRYVHMTLVHGDQPYVAGGKRFDWNYAISEAALQKGLTEHQIIHIAEQIAVQFHKRMVEELGVKRRAA